MKDKATKQFQADLKKYAGITGVPDYGEYTGYITCDWRSSGCRTPGRRRPARASSTVSASSARYDGAGLTCAPVDISLENFGKAPTTSCSYFVYVKDGKFVVMNKGKPVIGKLVGSKEALAANAAGDLSSRHHDRAHPEPERLQRPEGSVRELSSRTDPSARRGTACSCRAVISRGMPSTRSLMLLRAISVVPPPMPDVWRSRKLKPCSAHGSSGSVAAALGPASSSVMVTLRCRDDRAHAAGRSPRRCRGTRRRACPRRCALDSAFRRRAVASWPRR